MFLRLFPLVLALLWQFSAVGNAQTTLVSIAPKTCVPGETTILRLTGTNFGESLKAATNAPGVKLRLQVIDPTQATLEVEAPSDVPLGAWGIWLAAESGVMKRQALLMDDLPTVVDSGGNQSQASAQSLPSLCAVDGVCDSSTSDFYKFQVAEGARVSIAVHAQELQSTMDPVVRLLDAAGKTLHLADDDSVGPDCKFSYRFASAGVYWVEVFDSRHAAGSSDYHLRIGDFPLLSHCEPLAVRAGETTPIHFVSLDDEKIEPQVFQTPANGQTFIRNIGAKLPGGLSSAWLPLIVGKIPQETENSHSKAALADVVSETADANVSTVNAVELALPIGISGRLSQPREVDRYLLTGKQGQSISIVTRTRSLGCPTLLRMRLYDAAGTLLVESPINDQDEWTLQHAVAADGPLTLEVEDLLKRGGDSYGYWIEASAAPGFQVALKPEAATLEQHLLEPGVGACAIDLNIARHGYEGPLEFALQEPVAGLSLLNPNVPAGAKQARLYLRSDEEWKSAGVALVRLQATAVDDPTQIELVESRSLARVKEPAVLFPGEWSNGTLALGEVSESTSAFSLAPAAKLSFARPVGTHAATFTLQRAVPEFKAGVQLLGSSLPQGWTMSATAENDTYTATLNRDPNATEEPDQIELMVYGEWGGRGRLETYEFPVSWFDPLRVDLQILEPSLAGGQVRLRAEVARRGEDPQPVTLTFPNLPAGITAPESLTIAADQSELVFELQVSDQIDVSQVIELAVAAKSSHAGNEFTVASSIAQLHVQPSPDALVVYPSKVELQDARDHQQLVIVGNSAQGTRDWTRFARLESANPETATVVDGVVQPHANGTTHITVRVGSLQHTVEVQVSGFDTPRPIAFESEVLVALSKQGCNSGACHGSPSGKGGFRLSLRAFDLKLDELTLIREDFGRRTNPLDAEQSLLLLKPLMKVAHGGGKQLHENDPALSILRDWIATGAQADPPETPRVTRLEVVPSGRQILPVSDGGQQLAVTAHFADGTQRDVTELAAYESSDTSVANIDERGFIAPATRGEIAILVRFLEHIESVPIMTVEEVPDFEWSSPEPRNYIDELVHAKLQQLKYSPSEVCSDAEFVRRVNLDVLGVLPTVSETEQFLSNTSVTKRAELIDALLDREEYAKFWALKWGDLLRMTSKLVGEEGVYKYHRWVEESLRSNMPYDQFATELLTGSGSTLENPPANFYRTSTDMNESVETISQIFLGARLQCAKCHNHPFERWTQDNYYGLGAFFNQVQRRKTERPGEMFVYTSFSGEVTQPRTGMVMQPWLPQQGSQPAKPNVDRRLAFADWLVAPHNPYFARIEANRLWSHLFSRGIVDPIDDFRDSNPPSNAPLLDALAEDFVESGYDRKHLLRVILNSNTYQASANANSFNEQDTTFFSHQIPRLLSAEQLLDAINRTLELQQGFGKLPSGTLATQLPAPDVVKNEFLKVFGQPERSTVCACERSDSSNLGMAIELFNGPMMHEKLRDGNNSFRKNLAAELPVEEVIRQLYLAALCREPNEVELQLALTHCAQGEDPAVGVEDLCWALFNTDEFLFQH
ncbi:DUF1549 domain-containing protein [Aureliella helgolandensis]|nr:DUF1549 domain-containing protein [Aureliella helgolandensis]